MFISQFSIDTWNGNQNEEIVKPANTWQELEEALVSLDGKIHTLVTLETDYDYGMSIGGGPVLFVVLVSLGNEIHYTLKSKSSSEALLNVGGQDGWYLANPISQVLEIAQLFAELGTFSKELFEEL